MNHLNIVIVTISPSLSLSLSLSNDDDDTSHSIIMSKYLLANESDTADPKGAWTQEPKLCPFVGEVCAKFSDLVSALVSYQIYGRGVTP